MLNKVLDVLRRRKKERNLEWMLAVKDEERRSKLRRIYFGKALLSALGFGLSTIAYSYCLLNEYLSASGSLLLADAFFFWRTYENMKNYLYWKKQENFK